MRTPSWTDRILWLGNEITQTYYGRSELTYSDHRPVRAVFDVELKCINETLKKQINEAILNQGPKGKKRDEKKKKKKKEEKKIK